jgi:hypothetical protein
MFRSPCGIVTPLIKTRPDEWSTYKCELPQGHEGPHGIDLGERFFLWEREELHPLKPEGAVAVAAVDNLTALPIGGGVS